MTNIPLPLQKAAVLLAAVILLPVFLCRPAAFTANAADNTPAAPGDAAPDHLHQAGPVTVEIVKQPNCEEDGSYYEIVNCVICGRVLSKTLITVLSQNPHQPGAPVRENETPATCAAEGGYDSVIYCEKCGMELQRVRKAIPRTDYHLSEFSLKRTVSRGENGETTVTFADAQYPPLTKQEELPERFDGTTLEADRYLTGDGSRRACANGEERCAICGTLLSDPIPHSWKETGRSGGCWRLTEYGYSFANPEIRYECVACGSEQRAIAIVDFFFTPGDADGDFALTPADARLVLRYAVGLGPEDNVIRIDENEITVSQVITDYDADGVITPADARLILRASVGLYE